MHKFIATDADYTERFQRFMQSRESGAEDVTATVSAIIDDIRRRGDDALADYTRRFDRWDANALEVTPQEIASALSLVSPEIMTSLKAAAARIRDYSMKQLPGDMRYTDELGVTLGWKWTPLDAVGLYVPGGTAAYPSSVLMNAIPAKTAGVQRLVMVVPAPEGALNPAVLAAAHVAGIDAIYKIGGAQAVAALAYGTKTIQPVDKIVGPGNAYVAEAKRQVFGTVGIDMVAGPSEILVVADAKNNPRWIAADLLSQAEHDVLAQSILITDNVDFADAVSREMDALLQTLPRRDIASASWRDWGAIIIVPALSDVAPLVDYIAAEHVELAIENPDDLAAKICHAGAIFLGRHTPEAIGDYIAGPSHVLPTSRTARFSSGLSVFDFIKRTSLIGCDARSLVTLADYAGTLADTEGLQAHAHSIRVRNS